MPNEIVQSIILIVTVSLAFLFPKTDLGNYAVQIAATLFILLFISRRFLLENSVSKLLESVVFTFVILLIVNTTGQTASPFFFLVYFLLFSLVLLLEPIISITMTFTLIIFFLLSLPPGQSFEKFLPVLSLAFLTPFALFLGQGYLQNKILTTKNENLQEDTFLFLSLMLKNHVKNIRSAADNFVGDHQLEVIKKSARQMEKLIEKFEKAK